MARVARSGPSRELRRPRGESELRAALGRGDEQAFAELVGSWSGMMFRLARVHVDSRAVAEEVVQEASLAVLRDLDRFEGRSSLRTWVLGIVVNLARSRARLERRSVPLSSSEGSDAVDPARFRPATDRRWPGHWASGPTAWPTPDDELLASETRKVILDAVAALPVAQREVLVLRDLAGFTASETCNILGLGDTNQRVLLHRARSRVRRAIERYFESATTT